MKGKTKGLGCKLPRLTTITEMKDMIAARRDSTAETLAKWRRLPQRMRTPAVNGQILYFAHIVSYLDGFWSQLDQMEFRIRAQLARVQPPKKPIE